MERRGDVDVGLTRIFFFLELSSCTVASATTPICRYIEFTLADTKRTCSPDIQSQSG